jgi:hypothetical protein
MAYESNLSSVARTAFADPVKLRTTTTGRSVEKAYNSELTSRTKGRDLSLI